jgi:DNA-binding MarR family transcriptional regulator
VSSPDGEPSRESASEQVEAGHAAAVILETVPPVMRAIRARMRQAGVAGLSVPQFRVLLYVRRDPGTGMSEIAEHLGTTLPATSELVNRLVRQGLVTRATDERERRRICLGLSAAGLAGLEGAEARTLAWLRGLVAGVPSDRLAGLVEGLSELSRLVAGAPASEPAASTRSGARRSRREDVPRS